MAEATWPITSSPRSNSTRRISENCADGEDMGEANARTAARGRAHEHIEGKAESRKQKARASAPSISSVFVSDERSRELFLIDGNSLAYRAFFALPETISTSKGFPTNAIFGFASMLVKILTTCSRSSGRTSSRSWRRSATRT
jgi:hypothetical protein